MKKFLSFLFALLFVANSFANDIAANVTNPVCDNATLNKYNGTANVEINWEPNTIALRWYDGDNLLSVPTAAQSCVYDGAMYIPSAPSRTGYTFMGWTVKSSVPEEYVQLEYLKSSGVQCIDTGVVLSSDNVTFEWNGMDSDAIYATLFGAELSGVYPDLVGISDARQICSLYGISAGRNAYLGGEKWIHTGYAANDNNFHSWSFVIKPDHSAYLVKDGTALQTIYWNKELVKTSSIGLYCNHIDGYFEQLTTDVAYKYFRIIDNGQTVFNGVPVRRISDDRLGMYDTVTGTFKTNMFYDTYGDFIGGPVLMDGYSQLEYLESSKTQYIDTGYVYTDNTTAHIIIDTAFVNFNAGWNMHGLAGSACGGPNIGVDQHGLLAGAANGDFNTGVSASVNTRYLFDLDVLNHIFTIKDVATNTVVANSTTFSNSYFGVSRPNFILFGYIRPDWTHNLNSAKIYSAKLYDNNVLVRNLIPARRDSDGVLGMYDTVTKNFFTNSGTGTFIAGPVSQ